MTGKMVHIHFAEICDHPDFDLPKLIACITPDRASPVGIELQVSSTRTKRQRKKLMARSIPRHIPICVDGWDFILRAPRSSAQPALAPKAPPMKRPVRRRNRRQIVASRPIPSLLSAAQVAHRRRAGPTPPTTPPPFSVWAGPHILSADLESLRDDPDGRATGSGIELDASEPREATGPPVRRSRGHQKPRCRAPSPIGRGLGRPGSERSAGRDPDPLVDPPRPAPIPARPTCL